MRVIFECPGRFNNFFENQVRFEHKGAGHGFGRHVWLAITLTSTPKACAMPHNMSDDARRVDRVSLDPR